MNEISKVLGDAFVEAVRLAVREEIQAVMANKNGGENRMMDPSNAYLTVKEAASLSRLAPSTIRLYIRKRELKAHQVGSRVIIKRADLEQFVEGHPIEIAPD